jgi:predicted esterase
MVVYDKTLDNNMIYFGKGVSKKKTPGLMIFLTHSDCDGIISPKSCVKVADDLEKVLPKIEELDTISYGHIAARGGYAEVLRKFITGCRLAAQENKPLLFY